VSTLRLATEAEYDPPETIVLDYVKEDEKWKLAGYQTISTEEEPFNLTFEDLQYSFTDYETGKVIEGEFVDEIEHDGENYLVIKYGEYQMVRNVKDSTFGYFDLEDNSEKQPEEDQKEDQKEEKTDVEKEASSSNEGVPSGKSDEKELLNYETITKEVDEDHLKFDVSYPKFSYEALDQPILSYVKEMLEEEKTYAEELFSGKIEGIEKGSYDEYEFSISFEVSSITESFVSVEFLEYRYHVGSAHGLHYSKTFNYDLKNNREITLKDVLNNDMSKVKELSKATYEKLVEDEIMLPSDGDAAKMFAEDDLSTFTLSEDSLVIHFQQYEVGSGADGIVKVPFTFQEIEEL